MLNGASSAGKTRTADALEPLLRPPCVRTGLDDILDRVRPFGAEPRSCIDSLRRAVRIATFQVTDGPVRLFVAVHREAATAVRLGQDVIVETALMDRRALRDAALQFAPLQGLFVGLKPPLTVSEQWEAARGDRPRGQARRHYARIHAHDTYDLVLDPFILTTEECARAILYRLTVGPPPTAFQQLVREDGAVPS